MLKTIISDFVTWFIRSHQSKTKKNVWQWKWLFCVCFQLKKSFFFCFFNFELLLLSLMTNWCFVVVIVYDDFVSIIFSSSNTSDMKFDTKICLPYFIMSEISFVFYLLFFPFFLFLILLLCFLLLLSFIYFTFF